MSPEKFNLDIINNLNAPITVNELELITKNLLGFFHSNENSMFASIYRSISQKLWNIYILWLFKNYFYLN